MIPDFTIEGLLPPGVHWSTWVEFSQRFGKNSHRISLIKGLEKALMNLRIAGCKSVYIDGSFVTEKILPNDYDGCWDVDGVDPELLHPFLLDFDNSRALQKAYFKGELFPSDFQVLNTNNTFFNFFQRDKNLGIAKGIVGLKL